jgi:hypothetical protein
MTEQEWLTCGDPQPMLGCLKGKASDRRLRLVAASFCRRIWRQMTDQRSREAVEVAERFADGDGTSRALRESRQVALGVLTTVSLQVSHRNGAEAAAATCLLDAMAAAVHASRYAWVYGHSADQSERTEQARLIRHIFGPLPFRSVLLDPAWQTSTVTTLAQAIYDDRAFDRLPILADALEEAGCANADVLNHCRSDGPHVRGCWVIDLLLGKK